MLINMDIFDILKLMVLKERSSEHGRFAIDFAFILRWY